MAEKYRFAEVIFYPENMIDNWQDVIEDRLQCPFAYAIHDKDLDCKLHGHCILVHNNTVVLSFFERWFNSRLSKPGCKCVSTVEPIINPRRAWDYLIHDTDQARKDKKYQYPQTSRICGNNFDVHHFVQIDENTKLAIIEKITDHILDYNIMDLTSLVPWIRSQGIEFFSVFVSRSSYFDRICGGNFKKWERSKKKES